MAAGGGDLQRALGLLLAFYLAEIDVVNIRGGKGGAKVGGRGMERTQTLEEFESLAQTFDPEYRRALTDDRRLRRILARQNHAAEFGRARQQRGRQCALDALDAPVKRQLAEHQVRAQACAILQHVLRGQDSQRQRKIECRALLARVGGREVDSHLAGWKFEARILERRLDPIERLFDRALGQPDQPMRRSAGADIDFDFDWKRVNPDQRTGYYACVQKLPSLLTAS